MHAELLELSGGSPGLRDSGLLESAIQQPQSGIGDQYFHSTIPSMAAAYLFYLAKNHAFVDGNKRVAAAACFAFLIENDFDYDLDNDQVIDMTERDASGKMDKDELIAYLEAHTFACPDIMDTSSGIVSKNHLKVTPCVG